MYKSIFLKIALKYPKASHRLEDNLQNVSIKEILCRIYEEQLTSQKKINPVKGSEGGWVMEWVGNNLHKKKRYKVIIST